MEMNNSPWPGRPGVIPVTSGNAEDANRYKKLSGSYSCGNAGD